MKYRDLVESGMRNGPGGHKCSCCKLYMTKAQIHRKLRRNEKHKFKNGDL